MKEMFMDLLPIVIAAVGTFIIGIIKAKYTEYVNTDTKKELAKITDNVTGYRTDYSIINGTGAFGNYAVGGIARKSPWIMQMCADVFCQPVIVPQFDNVPARGSAVCAAVALGKTDSAYGYRDFEEAAARLIPKETVVYQPDPDRSDRYCEVYQCYRELHDLWGIDNTFMKRLKALRSREHHDKQ